MVDVLCNINVKWLEGGHEHEPTLAAEGRTWVSATLMRCPRATDAVMGAPGLPSTVPRRLLGGSARARMVLGAQKLLLCLSHGGFLFEINVAWYIDCIKQRRLNSSCRGYTIILDCA